MANGTTVIFPAAENSLKSIQKGLSPDTKIIELPIYQTVPVNNIETCCEDVLIFTSPSNVEAYFAINLLEPGQKVIAIGHSTGKKLEEYDVSYTLPFTPDEVGLAEAVFGLV